MRHPMIAVVNESARVSDRDVTDMVHAVNTQLVRDLGPIWGPSPTVTFAPKGRVLQHGALRCTISDTPDVPGAAGYHDEGPDGLPYIKIFTFEGAPSLEGPEALSVTLSHEVIELTLDAAANLWADGPDGADYAREGCDAPEAQTYKIGHVTVSNFVYPAFFDPKSPAGMKLDQLGLLKTPFETPPGGYQIRRTELGRVKEVFGKHAALGHDVHALGGGLFVVFGEGYDPAKKAAKSAKVSRRRAK